MGSFFLLGISLFVLDPIFIPDPCYYHTHEITIWIDLFYEINAGEGFHPYPNLVYIGLFSIIGMLLGYMLTKYLTKRLEYRNNPSF